MSDATVLIVTRNRREELRRALQSVEGQSSPPEVVVVDDGSTDGTDAMVRQEFPRACVHRSEESRGSCVQRNVGMAYVRTPIAILLDDDVVLPSPLTIEQTLADFDDPRVGAVAIPHVDVGLQAEPRLRAPRTEDVLVTSEFVACAAAVRRDAFLEAGGFREPLFHQGEERDLCVRLLGCGWAVRVGRADPIHHHPSSIRSIRLMDLNGRRNTILYAWFNEPFPFVVVRIAEMTVQGLVSGLRVRRPLAAVHGLLLGYRACWQERGERRPLPVSVIRLFRRLWKRGPLPLAEVERRLPAPSTPRAPLVPAPLRRS